MCRLTDLLQQYRSAVQTVNKNQGDYEDQQQEMNSEEWQKSKQEMESIRQELDKIDRECMFGILKFVPLLFFSVLDFFFNYYY